MAMDGRGGEGQRWAFECVVRASVTRTEVPSSAVVGVVDAGRTVTVTRLVDAPKCGVRRLFLPDHGGWVGEEDNGGRVLFELREPPLQLTALSTRQSLLAFSDGVDITERLSAQSDMPVSKDLFGLPQAYRQPPCLLEQRAVATEALANFVDTYGEAALLELHPSAQLRDLVRDHGVAPARRRRLWMAWSGAAAMKEARPDGYSALLHKNLDQISAEQIESDLPRTCPSVSWFTPCGSTDADGICAMRRVLRAFTADNPTVGYTQSLNFLAAFILLVFEVDRLQTGGQRAAEAEEDCFWLLTALARRSLRGYHTENMRVVRVDARVFDALLEAKAPKLAAHLKAHDVLSLDFISARWLLCCFHGILPAEAVARIFDNMLLARHNAPVVLLRIGLAVLLRAAPRLLACDCNALLMEKLLHSPDEICTAADIDMLFNSAWHKVGAIPSVRVMRERVADAQQEEDLKRWASPAQDLPCGIESGLGETFPASVLVPSSASATCRGGQRYHRSNLVDTQKGVSKSTRRRSRARVWDEKASKALAKAASSFGIGGMDSWLAVEGEGAPAPPLARALSDRDGNKPLERRLPCASPAAAAGASCLLKRTHSGVSRATASARKLHAVGGPFLQELDKDAPAKRRKTRDPDAQQEIELTDLRGLSAGKKLRLLCDSA